MEILRNIADNMNELLDADQFDSARLEEMCLILKEQSKVRFRLMDFEYLNEERLKTYRDDHVVLIWRKNFKAAANKRDHIKKCEKYIRFKRLFRIEKSMFHFARNKLVYFYTGTAKNDLAIYSRLTSTNIGFFQDPKAEKTNLLKELNEILNFKNTADVETRIHC